jgi:hypothetical protein
VIPKLKSRLVQLPSAEKEVGTGFQRSWTKCLPEYLSLWLLHRKRTRRTRENNNRANSLSSAGELKTPATGTLASFFKSTNSTTVQVRKFLATAVWLHDTQQKKRLVTTDVSKALKDSNQSRLGNPSEMLNQNITKGFCDRDGKSFFVTDEGRAELTK